jgi:hypothetical protein
VEIDNYNVLIVHDLDGILAAAQAFRNPLIAYYFHYYNTYLSKYHILLNLNEKACLVV